MEGFHRAGHIYGFIIYNIYNSYDNYSEMSCIAGGHNQRIAITEHGEILEGSTRHLYHS